MTGENRVWAALWTPTITTIGAVIVALASSWSSCNDMRGDVKSIKSAVEQQTAAIERLTTRADVVDARTLRAEEVARKALASCGER